MKPTITYEDFSKLDLRVGQITKCEKKEDADKLLRLTVDFGEEIGTRTILSAIAPWYTPEELQEKSFVFIVNLEPRSIRGEESQGMILAAEGEKPLPLTTSEPAQPGAYIK